MAAAHLVRPGSLPRSFTSDAYSPFTGPSHDRQSPKGRVTFSLLQASCSADPSYCEEEFVKASKGGSSAPSTTSTGPSPPVATTSPKTEIKKKRKRKSVKRTVTSETVSPPEKRKKIISESPDSQAEGPFCDSDTVSVSEGSPHAT